MNAEFYRKAIEKMFYIINKDMVAVPFTLNYPQNKILNNLKGMDIILKARQEGISSLMLAVFTVDFLMVENIRCVVVSHEEKSTRRLFDRVKYFLSSMVKTWPGELPYKLKYNSRSELVNTEKNSTFYIGTAGARAFGHGDTINNLHCSELSRWPDPENMMVGLLQAVPKNGKITIETTANGFGDYFYKLWHRNSEMQNPFKTHFLAWFELPEYAIKAPKDFQTEDNHPIYGMEQSIQNQFHLSFDQMWWRRWKIDQLNGNLDSFNEQFPSTPEEAFIVSGNPVWSPSLLKWYLTKTANWRQRGDLVGFSPPTLEENEKGHLKIWHPPKEGHRYVIGADVSEGKVVSESEGGKERDKSCAQVLDKTTYEQVAVWHGTIDPDLFGRKLETLGNFYNRALIGVERNAIGLTTLVTLRDLNYPHLYYREKLGMMTEKQTAELGWQTDIRSKELMIHEGTNLLRDKHISIYDAETIGEMMSYVRDAGGHANAAPSAFDDRVMALLIAIMMLGKQTIDQGNEIERGDTNLFSEGGFMMRGVSFNNQGMPADPDDIGGDSIF